MPEDQDVLAEAGTRTGLTGRVPGGRTIVALTFVLALDSADQSTIGSTAPEVRKALSIGSTQIGLLATSSTFVGLLSTLPFGLLADRRNRVAIIRAAVTLWTVATVAVGLSPNFGLMLSSHCLLGVVTGAASPMVTSIVGDLIPRDERGRVYSVLLLGELGGAALGTVLPGEVAATLGWRWGYTLLGSLGVLVLVVLTGAREPERRQPLLEDPDGSPPSLWQTLRVLVRIRTNVLLILASALGYFFFAGVQTFGLSLWIDEYGVAATIAPVLVLIVGASIAIGVVIGGPLGDRLVLRGIKRGRIFVVLTAFGSCVAVLVPGLVAKSVAVTLPLLVLAGILLGTANPSLDATRVDIVPSRFLGTAEALRNALRDGADAISPLMFGLVSAHIGLRDTFVSMTAALAVACVLGLLSARTYVRDAVAAGSIAR